MPDGTRHGLGGPGHKFAAKPPATDFEIGLRRFGMLITRFTILMVLFVLVVNISFHRPALESLMFALALAVGDPRTSTDDRHGHLGPLGDAAGHP